MSAFGFDPSIILSGLKPIEPNPDESIRTGMQFGDTLYKRQQARSLAALASQNAGSFSDPLARSYALGGFGEEAQDAEKQALARQELGAQLMKIHSDISRGQASTIKTPEQYKQWISRMPPDVRSAYGLSDEYDPEALKAFAASGLDPLQRTEYAEKIRRQGELANPDSVTSQLRASAAKGFGLPVAPGTPGNAIDDKELDLGERAQAAKLRQETTRLMMGLGGTPGGDTEPWVKSAALQYHLTGKMPDFGRDPGGYKHLAVQKLAAQIWPDDNVAANAASYKANSADMEEAQKQAGLTDVNEGKALGDIQVFKSKMANVFDSKSPWLNAAGRKLQENSGNPDVSAFLAARTALVNGVNRVLASGNLSDSSRKEAEDLLKSDASINQINSVLDVLTQDMSRSKAAMHQRVSNARSRIGGTGGGEDAAPATGAAPIDAAKVSARIKDLVASGVTDRDEIKRRLRAEGLAK